MQEIKLFVIIVTYKGHSWYERCFTSLRNSTIPVQTVVIDNASNDGTVEYVREHFPEIHLIESKENLGFGRANNLGMRYALDNGCDYVFLLNQDAWIDTPDTLKKMVEIYEQHPEYGILSPMHLNVKKDGLVMDCFCRRPDNKKLIEDLYLNQLTDVYDTRYIHAAAWMLSRNTLNSVGGFDPIYFHYAEDDNYLHRVLYHGLKVGVCPSTRIIHAHQESILSKSMIERRHRQSLLFEWTNINKSYSIYKIILYYLRKSLVFALSNKYNLVKVSYSQIFYCISMRKRICRSRSENIIKKPSWL